MTDDFTGTRVLVTGASGFIGRHLCAALAQRGAHIVAFGRGGGVRDLPNADVYTVDLRDRETVRSTVQRTAPTHVVHLAALRLGGGQPNEFRPSYEANLLATCDLAEAVLEVGGCRRFAYLSSAEEYGRAPVPFDASARESPLTAYGLSKLAATQFLQALGTTHDFPIAVLRATVVYGPGQQPGMFVPSLVRALVTGKKFPMTEGRQLRDLLYVEDLVDGILRALLMAERHDGAIHLSAGAAISIREVALLAAKIAGRQAESLLEFGAVPYRRGEAMEYWADNTATFKLLGWFPHVSLEEGLRRTIAHFRAARGDV